MFQENILHGPPEIEMEDPQKSLGEFFIGRFTAHGNKSAQVDVITGKSHTYDEIHSMSLRLAETMRYGFGIGKWHLGPGDSVAICSGNSVDFCIPVVAAIYLGVAVAPLNPTYTTREMEHALNISKPKVVFCSESRLKDIVNVARATKFVKSVVLIDEIRNDSFSNKVQKTTSNREYVININSLLFPVDKFIPSIPLDRVLPKVNPKEQVALIMCSSGTTGLPKGVMLSQHNILTSITHLENDRYSRISDEDIMLGLLPFFHAFGLVTLFTALAVGAKIVIMPHFEGDLFLKSIEKYKVTVLFLVPPIMMFISKDPRVAKYNFSCVRDVICGAAPLSKGVQERVETIINHDRSRIGAPPILVRQGYGLTETTLGVLMVPFGSNKIGSSGTLVSGTQCKVVDLVTGKALGPHKEGELCFRGALIMKGYLGNVEATAATIDEDGWLRTGDIGYYDEDGFFYIVDRLKELIKYKGFQVAPAELEGLLLTNPSVEDAAVVGIPDEAAGELPLAFVVRMPGTVVSEAELVKFIEIRVSPQKRLRGGVRFVKSIPKTASGKILRRELRIMYKSKL